MLPRSARRARSTPRPSSRNSSTASPGPTSTSPAPPGTSAASTSARVPAASGCDYWCAWHETWRIDRRRVLDSPLSEAHLATLRLLCDTVVPRLERDPDPDGFWGRTASDVGADAALAELVSQLPPEQLSGAIELLEALDAP